MNASYAVFFPCITVNLFIQLWVFFLFFSFTHRKLIVTSKSVTQGIETEMEIPLKSDLKPNDNSQKCEEIKILLQKLIQLLVSDGGAFPTTTMPASKTIALILWEWNGFGVWINNASIICAMKLSVGNFAKNNGSKSWGEKGCEDERMFLQRWM